MKKMTFAVWFTALLAVFTFSSCLDSDDNATRSGAEIVQVTGYMGLQSFKSAGGYEIIPTNQSEITMEINTKYAYITYSYQSADVVQGMKQLKVQLYGVLPIEDKYLNSSLDEMKEYSNAPVRNITYGSSYEFFPVSFWDANTMFLPINYFIKDLSDKTELKNEVNSHMFEVYCDVDDPEAEDTDDLILHVGHHVMTPELNKERNYKINTNMYYIDLRYAVGNFETKNGKKPSRILIKYDQSSNGEYNDQTIVSTTVEIDYSAILNATQSK